MLKEDRENADWLCVTMFLLSFKVYAKSACMYDEIKTHTMREFMQRKVWQQSVSPHVHLFIRKDKELLNLNFWLMIDQKLIKCCITHRPEE